MNIITDALRYIFWMVAYSGLNIMDKIYNLTLKIGALSFFEIDDVWKWWRFMIAYVVTIVTIKVAISSIKIMFSEEKLQNYNLFLQIAKIFAIVMAIGLSPIFLKATGDISNAFINNVGLISGVNSTDTEPSTIVVNASMNIDTDEVDVGNYNEAGELIETPTVTYKLNDVEITEKVEGDSKTYKFFPKLSDIFTVLVISLGSSVLMALIAIQIAQRLFQLVALVLVAPFPISSLVDEGDDSFGQWVKMIFSAYLTNFFQILLLMVVMSLTASDLVAKQPFLIKIVLLLSGLMFLLSGVPQIARLIGADTSSAGSLQQLSSLKQASFGAGVGVTAGLAVAGKTLGSAKTGLSYGIGRMMGGNPFGKSPNSGGGGTGNNFNAGASGVGGDSGGDSGGGGAAHFSENNGGQSSQTEGGSSQQNTAHFSKADSFANRTATKAYAKTGFKGVASRAAVNMATHSYQKASSRLRNNKFIQKTQGVLHNPHKK